MGNACNQSNTANIPDIEQVPATTAGPLNGYVVNEHNAIEKLAITVADRKNSLDEIKKSEEQSSSEILSLTTKREELLNNLREIEQSRNQQETKNADLTTKVNEMKDHISILDSEIVTIKQNYELMKQMEEKETNEILSLEQSVEDRKKKLEEIETIKKEHEAALKIGQEKNQSERKS